MKTLLHLIETTGPGGAETVFLNLFRAFRSGDFRSVALVSEEGWVDRTLRAEGVEPAVTHAKGSFNWRYLRDIVRVVRREQVDLIQAHLPGACVYACLAGMVTRTPVVSVFHGAVDVSEGDRLMAIKIAAINAGSGRIVSVSEGLQEDLKGRTTLRGDRMQVIYNGVPTGSTAGGDGARLRRELGLPAESVLVCSVGNVRSAKGYQFLVDAAGILKDRAPHIHFLIAGQGKGSLYDGILESRAEQGVTDTVHFLGFRSDGMWLLESSDLFLLPSTSEGFSISTIEAMSAGLPVIATRSGGPQEILTPEVDGLLIEPGSGQAIADAVLALAADPERRVALAAAASRTVAERFSLAAMIEAYEGVYRELLGMPSTTRS